MFDCFRTSSETSWSFASAAFICACILALLKLASISAPVACVCSRSFCNCTFRFSSPAKAAASFSSASCNCCSSCGFVNSRITLSGFTAVPGRRMIFSTRPCVVAGIHRMSSGVRMPSPRTCRTIGPRLTISGQITARSTVGAAGFSRDNPTLTSTTTSRPTTA